jgi:SAM-dependent methyltransferase
MGFWKKHNEKAWDKKASKVAKAVLEILEHDDVKNVLDVGAYHGLMLYKMNMIRPNKAIKYEGIDVLVPDRTYWYVKKYDGQSLPYKDNSFDAVLLIDTYHHAEDPDFLLSECIRVTKKYLIIKDHYYNNFLEWLILCIVDNLGNANFGIKLNYNFRNWYEWKNIIRKYNLKGKMKKFRQKKIDIIRHILIKAEKKQK